jgi:hypothetical protein
VTRAGSRSRWSSSARRACSSLRSGSSAATKRSSPHHTSTLRQSTAERAGERRTARAARCPPHHR